MASKYTGYMGKVILVDLTAETVKEYLWSFMDVDTQTPKAKADFTMLFQDLMETISASGQCLFTSYAFFPSFLLTKPNGVITKTVNAAATHMGGTVRLINKCPR